MPFVYKRMDSTRLKRAFAYKRWLGQNVLRIKKQGGEVLMTEVVVIVTTRPSAASRGAF